MSRYDPAREQRDEAMRTWHNLAVSHGDDRVLLRATTGELYSYRAEEIGFTTSSHGNRIRTGWGMYVTSVLCVAMALPALVFAVITPGATGWERAGIIFVSLFMAAAGLMFFTYGRLESRAKRLRRKRRLPEPILDSRG